MFVQQVVLPGSRHRSWTVLGTDGVPVEPVERYLAFLQAEGETYAALVRLVGVERPHLRRRRRVSCRSRQ